MHREKSGSSGDTGARARSDRVNDGRSLLRPIRSLLRCNAEVMVRSAQRGFIHFPNFFVFLTAPKLLSLGNLRINLTLPSLIRIFGGRNWMELWI